MTCKACGQPYGCNHSDAEYQGVVPPMIAAALSSISAVPGAKVHIGPRDEILDHVAVTLGVESIRERLGRIPPRV